VISTSNERFPLANASPHGPGVCLWWLMIIHGMARQMIDFAIFYRGFCGVKRPFSVKTFSRVVKCILKRVFSFIRLDIGPLPMRCLYYFFRFCFAVCLGDLSLRTIRMKIIIGYQQSHSFRPIPLKYNIVAKSRDITKGGKLRKRPVLP
jgi:hypothetical protein